MRKKKTGSSRTGSSKTGRAKTGRAKTGRAKPAKAKTGGAWDAFFVRVPGEQRYWLAKSEPDVFSFSDLLRIHNKTTNWNGIRNFVARNFLRDGMKLGDRVFFYHSGASPEIVGICEVVREGYPDETAFDATNPGHDPKSDKAKPTWFQVDIRAVAQFTRPVTLAEIKSRKELKHMAMLRIGRLSVTPVTAAEWGVITALANRL
jgi:predicted RNA-binding protein with PUA-like domain